jgi:hypothetical protein
MKSKTDKYKRKIVLMDVEVEFYKKNLIKKEKIIELQEKVKHLELEKSPRFTELHHSSTFHPFLL